MFCQSIEFKFACVFEKGVEFFQHLLLVSVEYLFKVIILNIRMMLVNVLREKVW